MLCGSSVNQKLGEGRDSLVGLVETTEGLDNLPSLGLVLFLDVFYGAGTVCYDIVYNLLEQGFLRIRDASPGLAAPEVEVFGGIAFEALQFLDMFECESD